MTIEVNVADDSYVSDMGAQVLINVQVAGTAANAFVTLTGPDGYAINWNLADYLSLGVVVGPNTVYDLALYAPQFGPKLGADKIHYVRHPIRGIWKLTVKNMDTINTASVFVEGVGRNAAGQDGLGAAMFEWGVLADPALVGSGADLIGAADAIRRINHSHLLGSLILGDSGGLGGGAMIPDDPNAIPDMGIPG